MQPELHPAYFDTHFRDSELPETWPDSFAIITAYQPTGTIWDQPTNELADKRLKEYLECEKLPHWRLTGFSPKTGHAEPGWAVSAEFFQACEIGLKFEQHAIYFVENGTLFISLCSVAFRNLESVGSFMERLSGN